MSDPSDFPVYRGELFIERDEPLSNDNIKFIQRTMNKIPMIATLVSVIGFTIILFAGAGLVVYVIFAIILIGMFLLFNRAYNKFRHYKAAGRKKVLRGILTEKVEGYRNNDTDSMKEYFFQVDLRKLEVD
jgi:hypothetical protein